MTRMIAILLMFATMLSFSGCGLVGLGRMVEKEIIPGKDSIIPKSESISVDSDPRETLVAAHKRLCEAKSYRATSVQTGPTGASLVTKMEYVAPDRARSIHYAGTDLETEFIWIGSRTFERSRGKWTVVPDPLRTEDLATKCELEGGRPAGMPGFVETELKLIGPETLNGIKVLTYRSTTDFRSIDGPDSFVVTTSVGVSDGRLYRIEIKTTKDPSTRLDTVTTYSDYDTAITIEAPI